jgi:hypothetical protein
LTAALYATAMPPDEMQQPLPASAADLATANRVEIAENREIRLSGQFGAEIDDGDEIKREAVLQPPAGDAKGEAEIELNADDRSRQELEVEVEGLTAKTVYQVLLDGTVVGTITTDVRGKGDLELARGTNSR